MGVSVAGIFFILLIGFLVVFGTGGKILVPILRTLGELVGGVRRIFGFAPTPPRMGGPIPARMPPPRIPPPLPWNSGNVPLVRCGNGHACKQLNPQTARYCRNCGHAVHQQQLNPVY